MIAVLVEKSQKILAKAPAFGIAFGCCALAVSAQTFKTTFASGYDGWTADFAEYAAADSLKRKLKHVIEPVTGINPAMTALRMTGLPSYRTGTNATSDLFPFLRKRFTGLSPNTEYLITCRLLLATAYGQFDKDTLWIKAGASTTEPVTINVENGFMWFKPRKGPPRGPGADMDTLGRMGHDGGGHRLPQPLNLDNAKHPFTIRSDASGSLWIMVGAEWLPSAGSLGVEFNVGAIELDFAARPASLAPRIRREGRGEPVLGQVPFRRGGAEWNLAGERLRTQGK